MQRTEANLEDHGRSKEQIDRLQAKAGEINGNSPCALGNGGGGLPPLRGYLSLKNPPSVLDAISFIGGSGDHTGDNRGPQRASGDVRRPLVARDPTLVRGQRGNMGSECNLSEAKDMAAQMTTKSLPK